MGERSSIMDKAAMRRVIMRIAHEIVERNHGIEDVSLIGIRRRGVPVAYRIASILEEIEGRRTPVGILDIGLYRDDWAQRPFSPVDATSLQPALIMAQSVILVDDVLFTGRTIRAALDAVSDFGRPKAIQLAVLIDRGHRELPIRADYVGKNVPTARDEQVYVQVEEIDGEDRVYLAKTPGTGGTP